jgi:chromosome partitioning protein
MNQDVPGAAGPLGTGGIRRLADAAAAGRDALARQGHAPDGRKQLRRFPLAEVARQLAGMDPAALVEALRARPDLPQGKAEAGGQRSFAFDETLALGRHFAREKAPAPRPGPSPGPAFARETAARARVVAVANFKGGVGKTSLAAHLAQAAALEGLRVLAIDLDSQGSLTSLFGGRVEDEWQTAFPLIARDFARETVAAKGEGALDETLREALAVRPSDIVQKTHWPGIDLIGAELNLYWAEVRIPVWRLEHRRWRLWDALTRALEEEGLLASYDLVLIDTPPALGYLTINALAAADIVLVPTGASFLEFESTGRFLDMLHTSFASIEEGENVANRMLGLAETRFEWDALRLVITRYEPAQQAELATVMTAAFGPALASHRLERTALIGQAGERVNTVYEADPRDFNPRTWARGRAIFDGAWAELKGLIEAARAERQEAVHGA